MAQEKSYVLKLNRSTHHLQDLDLKIREWLLNSNNYSFSHKFGPDPGHSVFVSGSVKRVPDDPFALLIGDIVQNLRNSLDHFALELARAHTPDISVSGERASQFPIFSTKQDFEAKSPRMIEFMKPEAKEFIEWLQPYNGDAESDALWRLNRLSNSDKHRVLNIGATVLGVIFRTGKRFMYCDIVGAENFSRRVVPDHVKTEFSIALPRGYPQENLEVEPTVNVCFAGGPLANKPVIDTLKEIQGYIVKSVFTPMKPFLRPH